MFARESGSRLRSMRGMEPMMVVRMHAKVPGGNLIVAQGEIRGPNSNCARIASEQR